MLRNRLLAARRRCFVGRAAELDLFRAALAAAEPPFSVLFVHAPGGMGKTALLRRFADLAVDAGVEHVRIDGRDIESNASGFLAALCAGLGVEADPLQTLGDRGRVVLLIDTYETLAGLDSWLREDFLPDLHTGVLVVIAGRQPPSSGWRADPGWRDELRVVSLPDLRPEETIAYLRIAGVPTRLHRQLITVTRGHPLALAVAADMVASGCETILRRLRAPDVVQPLLERFVDDLPSADHRHALQVCAQARTTTEAVLRFALERDDVRGLFEWLRGLSFVESGPHGIFPHDLARDVLVADLGWRDPEVRGRLHGQVRAHAIRRLRAAVGSEKQVATLDFLFTEYADPEFRAYWDQWATAGQALGEPAVPQDRAEIVGMVERHEGPASAAIAARWFDLEPEAFTVYRSGLRVQGFLAWLSLNTATTEDIDADPGTRSVWRYATATARPAPDQDVTMARFLIDRDAYQGASHLFNVGAVQHTLHVLDHPRLSWDFLTVADPEFWAPLWRHVGYDRTEAADFSIGDRRFAIFSRDWRTAPLPTKWAELLSGVRHHADPSASLNVSLPRPEFEAAVRQALRDYRRLDVLSHNPLISSRLIRQRADGRPAADVLAATLQEAADALRQHPRDEKLYRVIDRTFLRPARTQELAAELLGLPSSTYRRHLGQGVARIVSWLWDQESAGPRGTVGLSGK